MRQIIGIFCLSGFSLTAGAVDTFGITQLYPSKSGCREWNSAHWNNGIARTFKYSPDPYDPTGWTEDHSSGTDGFRVDGLGMMRMSGGGPRFHINSLITKKVPAQKFRDIEFTAYYRRLGLDGANYSGMVVGARSGPLGHASPGGDVCDATTYYGRFRNDGKWDFEKELKHPGSTYWSGSGFKKQDPLWKGNILPVNRWIGMKYLVYNIQNNTQVKLLLYIDTVSNGDPKSGGHWENVGEVIDGGSWPSGDVSGCDYEQTMVITEGGGTMLMRTDKDTADYKMVSIREIDVSAGPSAVLSRARPHDAGGIRLVRDARLQSLLERLHRKKIPFAIMDIKGRITQGAMPTGARAIPIYAANNGICLLLIGKNVGIRSIASDLW